MVDNVTVTQEDRDAAANHCKHRRLRVSERCVREGRADNDPLVQAFARHRIASIARLSPAPEGADANHMSPEMAEVCGLVSAMHTKWMQREELMRQDGGLDLMVKMANLLDGIVDAVPELQRKLWSTLSRPPAEQVRMREAEYARGIEDAAKAVAEIATKLSIKRDTLAGGRLTPQRRIAALGEGVSQLLKAEKAVLALTPPPKGQNDG